MHILKISGQDDVVKKASGYEDKTEAKVDYSLKDMLNYQKSKDDIRKALLADYQKSINDISKKSISLKSVKLIKEHQKRNQACILTKSKVMLEA